MVCGLLLIWLSIYSRPCQRAPKGVQRDEPPCSSGSQAFMQRDETMRKRSLWTLAIAASCLASVGQDTFGQAPRQQRQEARAQRQEARQEARQAVRQNVQPQRLGNQVQYYNQQSWSQLDPWITRNQVPPANRVARVANAAVNATERALNTANAATANTAQRAAFGYSDPNAAGRTWFYDYYTYNPTYYSAPAPNTTVYGSAARYYDLNGDGVYDSLNTFRDSDNDGVYDAYDRYDFAAVAEQAPKPAAEPAPTNFTDAKRHTISGQIEATKVAKVNGNENMVAQVADKQDPEVKVIVDLGAAERWQGKPVQQGDSITATGPVEQVGEKQVLIAESVSIGDQKDVQVSRSAPVLEGQVVDVTRTEVKGTEHTLAIIDDGSTRQIVDLGPSASLKVNIAPQVKLSVQGVPVQVRDRSVLMAERVVVDGQEIPIQRWFR